MIATASRLVGFADSETTDDESYSYALVQEQIDEYVKAKGYKSHYDIENNRIVLYYDLLCRPLAPPDKGETLLTNFDEDDVIEVHVIHPRADEGKYRIIMNRVDDKSKKRGVTSQSLKVGVEGLRTLVDQLKLTRGGAILSETTAVFGPYEAGTYRVEIQRIDTQKQERGSTSQGGLVDQTSEAAYKEVTINPLSNFDLQVGVAASLLMNPDDYKIANLKGTPYDTIVATSGPVRGISTLNVVIYNWFLIQGKRDKHKNFGGIFPTLGVGIDNPKENFLAGIVWEVSPVVGLSGGVHFGKVKRLPEEFALGEDVLWADSTLVKTGTQDKAENIETVEKWQANGYFGATVDLDLLIDFLIEMVVP